MFLISAVASGRSLWPRRLMVGRSPRGRPGSARLALLGIAALAGVLYSWNIRDAGYTGVYSTAVKSMSVSWRAFMYGAFDPGATITLDKLAGSFLPQAIAARMFGFHQWTLALPQAMEGVLAVLVMHRAVRRWAGPMAGVLAAGIFALTPVTVSMFGHAMEDGALTLCLVLAADRFQRAVATGRLRSLVLAGTWVGIGFQCKMLQAWIIVPAFVIGYLMAAPVSLRRRLGHLLVTGVVTAGVSLSWIMVYTFIPPTARPFVDGSITNSAFAMVFGYNGLGRFGFTVPGSLPSPAIKPPIGGGHTWTQLISDRFVTQIGWLYPLAAGSLLLGLWWYRRAARTDQLRAGFVTWGIWLMTSAAVLSLIRIPHTTYMALLAPAVAALSGTGIVLVWRAYRDGGARSRTLPILTAAQAGWTVYLWRDYRTFLPWLVPTVVVLAASAILVMVAAQVPITIRRRIDRSGRSAPPEGWGRIWSAQVRARALTAGLVVGVGSILAAPSAWAVSGLDPRYDGNAANAGTGASIQPNTPRMDPGPGPGISRCGQAPAAPAGTSPSTQPTRGVRTLGSDYTLNPEQCRLLRYALRNSRSADYVFATDSWIQASPYIGAAGIRVLPMGGYHGITPHPTLAEVQRLVHTGQLQFVLLTPAAIFEQLFGGNETTTVATIRTWVSTTCTPVPPSAYDGTELNASNRTRDQEKPAHTPPTTSDPGGVLYHCRAT